MKALIDGLLISEPKNLDYLLKTYCKENAYLKLSDLKIKHKEYLFNIIRVVRRCLETQLLNINNPGIGIFSLFSRMLTLCLNYYNSIDTLESSDKLQEALQVFKNAYEEIVAELTTAIENRSYLISTDLAPRHITSSSWETLAERAAMNFSMKGHHLNILIPYPKEDIEYLNLNVILRSLFPESYRRYFSFYTEDLDNRLFSNGGQCLHTTKERTNMRTKSFDVVIATHDNMFDSIRPRISAAAGYMKKDGAMVLIGLTTSFTRLDLRRISATLQDINVYFYTSQTSDILNDEEICIIVGRNKDEQSPSELSKLVDIFTQHRIEDLPFSFYGSNQEETPLFASYDISEAEATVLLPDMQNITKSVLTTLIPKSVEDTRRPLLPFSAGQLGLVLISGDINGVVEEPDTQCHHIVKGSSKQRRDNKSEILETDDNGAPLRIRRTESVYASTNVNIVLPNGHFVELH